MLGKHLLVLQEHLGQIEKNSLGKQPPFRGETNYDNYKFYLNTVKIVANTAYGALYILILKMLIKVHNNFN